MADDENRRNSSIKATKKKVVVAKKVRSEAPADRLKWDIELYNSFNTAFHALYKNGQDGHKAITDKYGNLLACNSRNIRDLMVVPAGRKTPSQEQVTSYLQKYKWRGGHHKSTKNIRMMRNAGAAASSSAVPVHGQEVPHEHQIRAHKSPRVPTTAHVKPSATFDLNRPATSNHSLQEVPYVRPQRLPRVQATTHVRPSVRFNLNRPATSNHSLQEVPNVRPQILPRVQDTTHVRPSVRFNLNRPATSSNHSLQQVPNDRMDHHQPKRSPGIIRNAPNGKGGVMSFDSNMPGPEEVRKLIEKYYYD